MNDHRKSNWNTNQARFHATEMLRAEITVQMRSAGFAFRFAIGNKRDEICVRLGPNVPEHLAQAVINAAYRVVREKLQEEIESESI
jgi:hypothetical protein